MLLQANLGLNVDFWHFLSPLGLFKAYFRPYFPNIETFNDPSGYFRPILGHIYRFLRFLMTPNEIFWLVYFWFINQVKNNYTKKSKKKFTRSQFILVHANLYLHVQEFVCSQTIVFFPFNSGKLSGWQFVKQIGSLCPCIWSRSTTQWKLSKIFSVRYWFKVFIKSIFLIQYKFFQVARIVINQIRRN